MTANNKSKSFNKQNLITKDSDYSSDMVMDCISIASLYDALKSRNPKGRLPISDDEFKELMDTIKYINSKGRDERSVTAIYAMSDYEICPLFEDFIYPNSVTISADFDDMDFVRRPTQEEVASIQPLSPIDFKMLQRSICSALFLGEVGYRHVSELRENSDLLLSNVESRNIHSVDGVLYCRANATKYIPIPLTKTFAQDYVYNTRCDIMITNYIYQKFSSLRSGGNGNASKDSKIEQVPVQGNK